MQVLELKIPPAALFIVFIVIMWSTSAALSAMAFNLPGASAIACVFAFLGAGIGVAGLRAFRRQNTTVDPMNPEKATSVVIVGIYRFTRNPMYLGLAFALLGWGVFLSNLGALLLVPLFAAYMTRFQIKPEERALLAKFGPDFSHYMSDVRRWI